MYISTVFHYVTGFNEGWIFFDDANRKNANAYWGTLPDGEYGRDTKIFYCCCSDGFAANAFIFPRTLLLQPRTQACSRYPSDQRRLGTERDRRIFPTSLTGDVTSEITEDDWERGCLSCIWVATRVATPVDCMGLTIDCEQSLRMVTRARKA